MATATATELNPTQQQAVEAFADKLLGRLADSLRMFLGRELKMAVGDVAILDSASACMRLPATAAGLSVDLDGADAPVLALLELPLALSLSHLARMGAPEELETLRGSPSSPTDDDLEQLRTTSSFFAAALTDMWPASGLGESSDVVLIQDGSWQSDQNPLGECDYLHVDATCTLEDLSKDTFSLVLPLSVAEMLVPALAPGHDASSPTPKSEAEPVASAAAPDTPGPGAMPTARVDTAPKPAAPTRLTTDLGQPIPVVCIDADAVADRIASQLESGAVERIPNVGSLEAWLKQGRVPALVIARITGGADDDLEELARLKRDRLFRGHPVMVLLEHPVKRTVLRCGRLGLVNVLPAQDHPDMVWRRVARWLRRRAVTA